MLPEAACTCSIFKSEVTVFHYTKLVKNYFFLPLSKISFKAIIVDLLLTHVTLHYHRYHCQKKENPAYTKNQSGLNFRIPGQLLAPH